MSLFTGGSACLPTSLPLPTCCPGAARCVLWCGVFVGPFPRQLNPFFAITTINITTINAITGINTTVTITITITTNTNITGDRR